MPNKELILELLTLISDITVDYDGYNSADSLKELIDEMADYIRIARKLLNEPTDADCIKMARKLLGEKSDREES